MTALALLGVSVECPVCGSRYRRFAVAAEHGTFCPRCLSLERHRTNILFLRRQTDIYRRSLRVLHVAPERGLEHELRRLRNLDYVTGDLTGADVDVQLDVTAIGFPDASFDVVLCSHVLEHVLEDEQAMREFRRILRPDGWALLNVPTDPTRTHSLEDPAVTSPSDRLARFGQEDHVRVYSRADFIDRLELAGFVVTVDPLRPTTEDRAHYGLGSGSGGWDHAYLCRPRITRERADR